MTTLPQPFAAIPRHRLGYSHPSPVHVLPNLSAHVCRANGEASRIQLWAKREDQAGGLACYGNKYRKFEYIIPDIKNAVNPVTIIVSEGAVQSNHTVQVAGMARVLGLKCCLLLHEGVGGLRMAKDKKAYTRVGNVQLTSMLGADVRFTDETDTGDENGPLIPILDELRARGEVPYWISSGASLHPLGGLGYARCAFEIAAQEEQLVLERELKGSGRFDFIFVACGSASTLAGLIAGFRLLDKMQGLSDGVRSRRRIIGVMTSPTKPRSYHLQRLLYLAQQMGALIGLDTTTDILEEDIHLDDRFAGEGYGVLDSQTDKTMESAARSDSLLLDPVYTAKVMSGGTNVLSAYVG